MRATLPRLRFLGDGLLRLVYPAVCQICLTPLGSGRHHFCQPCSSLLETNSQSGCWRCGSTVGPFENSASGCVRCRNTSFPFSRVVHLGSYDGLMREVVLRMKSQAGENLANAVGGLFASHIERAMGRDSFDGVLSIPLHWRRRLSRGYNQSEALARAVAAGLGLPYLKAGMVRVRSTPPQVGLSASQRRHNVCGAFLVRNPSQVRGQRLLLLDDVMTTSSTAGEAARVLRNAGAVDVVVGVLAHRTV